MTTARVMMIAAFVAVAVIAARPPTDTDTWWHLRSGEWTLQNGFIYEDPFSYTRDDVVWVNHSWGAQILLYAAYRTLGDVGLVLYTMLAACIGMGFVWATGRGGTFVRAFVIVLAAGTAAVFWSARPQMISFVLSAATLWLLWGFVEDGRDRLWAFVPLMLVWGNTHAGFSIGFVLLGGGIAGAILERWFVAEPRVSWGGIGKMLAVGIVGAAAVCINPYGPRMLLVPFQTLGLTALSTFVQEWNPPDFQNPQFLPFILMLAALFGTIGASQRRLRWTNFILLGGTLYLALTGARNVALFAVVAAPVIITHLNDILIERQWHRPERPRVSAGVGLLNTVLATVLIGGGLTAISLTLAPAEVAEEQAAVLPVAAVEYLAENTPPGNLFNSYNWGGYLAFALPEYPVFVDGRTDLYGDAFLNDYARTYTTVTGWEGALQAYGVNTVLVERGSPLDAGLMENGWQLAYSDSLAVVYTRPAADVVD